MISTVLKKAVWVVVPFIFLMFALYALGFTDTRGTDNTYALNGMVFTGELGDGKFQGNGTIVFENNDTYEGNLSNGRFDGCGIFTSTEGWRYEGEFRIGLPEGVGTFTVVDENGLFREVEGIPAYGR